MATTKILPELQFRNIKMDGETFEGEEYRPGIVRWVRFKANLKLYVISLAVRGGLPKAYPVACQIWELQDGMPGVLPEECEWDWSAIRDSSEGAIDQMYEVASQYIDVPGLVMKLVKASEPFTDEEKEILYHAAAQALSDEKIFVRVAEHLDLADDALDEVKVKLLEYMRS